MYEEFPWNMERKFLRLLTQNTRKIMDDKKVERSTIECIMGLLPSGVDILMEKEVWTLGECFKMLDGLGYCLEFSVRSKEKI